MPRTAPGDTVGYQKIDLSKGFNMMGVQFADIGGEAKDISTFGILDDSFAGYDDDDIFGTEMRVWNGIG